MLRLILAALVLLTVPDTAAADAGADVAEGRAWMHSFEYERALTAFVRAEQADPANVMAYWGQAMCYEQLLWGNENVEEARAILGRMRQRGALARANALERAWIASLDPLFGDGDRASRVAAYAAAMGKMAAALPEDPDVAAFYGLALLATRTRGLAGAQAGGHAHDAAALRGSEGGGARPRHGPEGNEGQLVGSEEQARAAEVFGRILRTHPKHPGALHYLIHTWDDPANAHKALDAARTYATVVPESSHARHMPAHVFVQLGMWNEAIASDEAAAAAADARVANEALPVTAADFHPLSWLVYEYAQAGRPDDARRALERLRGPAQATQDPRLLSLLATLRARLAIEEQRWDALPGPGFVNYDELFAVGFSAAQRGDLGLAEQARVRLGTLAAQPRYAARRPLLEIMALQVGAAIRARSDDVVGALALLADATRAERALPASIGPPALIKPAQEQYAELLLDAGRRDEAIAQFDGALERARGRRLSVEGRARAATSPTSSRAARTWPLGGGLLAVLAILAARRRRTRSA